MNKMTLVLGQVGHGQDEKDVSGAWTSYRFQLAPLVRVLGLVLSLLRDLLPGEQHFNKE